jgi:hypothetical protein
MRGFVCALQMLSKLLVACVVGGLATVASAGGGVYKSEDGVGGWFAWKSKCLGFDMLEGNTSTIVTSGQLSLRQIVGGDMHVNASLWMLKFGDPASSNAWTVRNVMQDASQGQLADCPAPAKSCFQIPVDVENCAVCITSMAMGTINPGDWIHPAGNAAWFIDQLPFPHESLASSNRSITYSFGTSPFVMPIMFDAYSNDPKLSLPPNMTVQAVTKYVSLNGRVVLLTSSNARVPCVVHVQRRQQRRVLHHRVHSGDQLTLRLGLLVLMTPKNEPLCCVIYNNRGLLDNRLRRRSS